MAHSIKITYFPMKGGAEPTRLALYIAGIEFEDERLNPAQMAENKASGKSPFLSYPTMTVDGEIYAESNAMLRYAGKLAGLYPECNKAAMKVDMVVDALSSIIAEVFKDMSKEGQTKCLEETFPRYFSPIDKMIGSTSGPFLLGNTMTIADLKVAVCMSALNSGEMLQHLPAGCLDKYSHILGTTKAVMSHEKVKEWNAAH